MIRDKEIIQRVRDLQIANVVPRILPKSEKIWVRDLPIVKVRMRVSQFHFGGEKVTFSCLSCHVWHDVVYNRNQKVVDRHTRFPLYANVYSLPLKLAMCLCII